MSSSWRCCVYTGWFLISTHTKNKAFYAAANEPTAAYELSICILLVSGGAVHTLRVEVAVLILRIYYGLRWVVFRGYAIIAVRF